jgi:PKD repeat protein
MIASPAQADRALSVQPPARTVNPGATFTLSVNIDDASHLAGFQFDVSYDESLISLDRIDPGALVAGKAGWSFQYNYVTLAERPGLKSVRVLSYNGSANELAGGSGSLAIYTLRASSSNSGATAIYLDNIVLSNGPGQGLPAVGANGSVTVASPNQPPTASFSYTPPNPTDLDVITFTDASSDDDGTVVGWRWAFGDGATSTAQNPTHQYADNGTYHVTLVVTDDDGAASAEYGEDIVVANVAPLAGFTWRPTVPTAGQTVAFTDASSDDDGTVAAWSWHFGDGGVSSARNPSHTYASAGTYTATLTVTDNDGGVSSPASAEVHVAPQRHFSLPDVSGYYGAQVMAPIAIDEAGGIAALQIDVSFNANAKTLVDVQAGALLPPTWALQYSQPSAGTVRISAHASPLSALPTGAGELAVITFQEKVGAAKGMTALSFAQVTLSDVNADPIAPVVTDDGANTIMNRPPVLDHIGDKTISEGEPLAFTVTASDPDGDALTYSASNLPSGADFNSTTRVFSWTPGYNQAGTYPGVHFAVTDGNLGDAEDITITVNDVRARNVYLPEVSAELGNQVKPAVSIDDAAGVGSFGFDIGFAAGSKTLVRVDPGALLAKGWKVSYSQPRPGVVRIAGSSSGGKELAPGPGELVVITFQERADAPITTTPLTFLSAALARANGTAISPVATHNGSNQVVAPPAPRDLYLPTISGFRGDAVDAPLTIGEAGGIARFQIDVGYASASKDYLGTDRGALVPGAWTFTVSQPSAGVIRIAASSPTNTELPSGGGALAVIHFREKTTAPGGTTALTFSAVSLSKGAGGAVVPVVTHAGSNTVNNYPPVAAFTWSPTEPVAGTDVQFTDQSSDDLAVTAWSWSFGDGGASTAQNPVHRYAAQGTYTVSLTVTDADGARSSTSHAITVQPPNPYGVQITKFTAPSRVRVGQSGNLVVTVRNSGAVAEDITVQVDRIAPLPLKAVETQVVHLNPGASAKVTFAYSFGADDAPTATFRATATTPGATPATATASTQVR